MPQEDSSKSKYENRAIVHLPDALIFIGAGLLIAAAFKFSVFAGLVTAGVIVMFLGFILAYLAGRT